MEPNPYQAPGEYNQPVSTQQVGAAGGWKWVLAAFLLVVLTWLVPFLNLVPLGLLGWATSRAWPQRARIIGQCMPVVALAFLGVLIVSGLPGLRTQASELHRWSGHILVILAYVCVPFAQGVLLHQSLLRRPVFAISSALVLFVGLAATFSASLTGYLDRDPVPDPVIAAETHNRFVVLHMFLLPTFLAAIFAYWHFVFRSPRAGRATQ